MNDGPGPKWEIKHSVDPVNVSIDKDAPEVGLPDWLRRLVDAASLSPPRILIDGEECIPVGRWSWGSGAENGVYVVYFERPDEPGST